MHSRGEIDIIGRFERSVEGAIPSGSIAIVMAHGPLTTVSSVGG